MQEGQTGLTFLFPEINTAVKDVRNAEDPYASIMDAHITIALPFQHINDLNVEDFLYLQRSISKNESFTVNFDSFGNFPGVLFLKPDRFNEFVNFHCDVKQRWLKNADSLMGGYSFVPHLTLAHNTDINALNKIQESNPHFLELSEQVTHVDLMVIQNGDWVEHTQFNFK